MFGENNGRISALDLTLALADFALFAIALRLGFQASTAQLASFALAAALLGISRRSSLSAPAEPAARFAMRFLFAALLALFLRGGIFALFQNACPSLPLLAVIPAVAASALVLRLAPAFFGGKKSEPGAHEKAILGATLFLVALRLVYMPSIELLPEESYYWNYAQHPALGYLDHPPMVAWLIRCGITLLGSNSAGVRIGAFGCWLVTAFFVRRGTRGFFGNAAANRALLLLAALPAFLGTGILMTPDAPLMACWAGALYFFGRVFFENSAWAWLGAGACIGLGMDSKYTIALAGVSSVAFMLFDKPARRWFLHPAPYLAAAFSVLLFTPVIFWNYRHEWASFVFQGPRRLHASHVFSLHTLIFSVIALLTPTGVLAAFAALRGNGTDNEKRRLRFAQIFTLLPLAVFTFFSLSRRVELNWTAPIWLALVPPVAFAMGNITSPASPLSMRLRAWWPATVALLMLAYGAAFYHLALGWPGVRYPQGIKVFPVGWADLGTQAARLQDALRTETGMEPAIVGMERNLVTSQLAFYHPDQRDGVAQCTGQHIFGRPALMYERWAKKEDFGGRPMVLIGLDRGDVTSASITRSFEKITDPREGRLTQNGKFVRPFFYRLGYSFRVKPQTAR